MKTPRAYTVTKPGSFSISSLFTLGEILRICDESGAFSYQNRFAVYKQMHKSEIKTSQFCHVTGDSESAI